MSDTVEHAPAVTGDAPGGPPLGNGPFGLLKRTSKTFAEQREATVFVVAVLLVVYFGLKAPNFLTKDNLVNLSQITAPVAIIAVGEVLLLICGEIDLSVGFVLGFSPFLMHYLIDYYSVPVILAIIIALLMGVAAGWVNGALTVYLRLPSFISTLGTGFILWGLMLTTSNAYPANIPKSAEGIGRWIGSLAWAEIIWAVIFVLIFQLILSRTRWGLHTVAVGGNLQGASEAGISVAKIKIGAFMVTGFMGAFVGLQQAFQTNTIDPSNASYQPMFYAIAGAVIGGTALAGGSGTIIGAFLGAFVLSVLTDGFNLIGISANPLNIIFGAAILVAMIANVQLSRLRRAGRS